MSKSPFKFGLAVVLGIAVTLLTLPILAVAQSDDKPADKAADKKETKKDGDKKEADLNKEVEDALKKLEKIPEQGPSPNLNNRGGGVPPEMRQQLLRMLGGGLVPGAGGKGRGGMGLPGIGGLGMPGMGGLNMGKQMQQQLQQQRQQLQPNPGLDPNPPAPRQAPAPKQTPAPDQKKKPEIF